MRGREAQVMMIAVLGLLFIGFGTKIAAQDASPAYIPSQVVRVDCGNNTGNATVEGVGFFGPDNDWHLVNTGSSAQEFQTVENGYLELVNSARVFKKPSSYKFEIQSSGAYWLRMYFRAFKSDANVSKDASVDITNNAFSVAVGESSSPGAGAFTVISNFNVTAEQLKQGKTYLYYEYYLHLEASELLVTFTPAPNTSYAFINGLELVSAPDNLYGRAGVIPYTGSTKNSYAPVDYTSSALETKYRINVGGGVIDRSNDSALSRAWDQDIWSIPTPQVSSTQTPHVMVSNITYKPALVPQYFAPAEVYASARVSDPNQNESWSFVVDPGFEYFVRLHFCEIQVTQEGERVFDIYINQQPSYLSLDIVAAASGAFTPAVFDFEVDPNNENHVVVEVGHRSPSRNEFHSGILNGIEILKIHDIDYSASVQDTTPPPNGNNGASSGSLSRSLITLTLILLINLLAHLL